MRIRHDGRTDRFYVQGGFVEVLDDVVSVLTQRAVSASEIDRPVVEEQLAATIARRAATPETRHCPPQGDPAIPGAVANCTTKGCRGWGLEIRVAAWVACPFRAWPPEPGADRGLLAPGWAAQKASDCRRNGDAA